MCDHYYSNRIYPKFLFISIKSNVFNVESDMTGLRNNKPLQQYFKPLNIDHLSFIQNKKQCQPTSFKNSKKL
jgi:hypothetical protein